MHKQRFKIGSSVIGWTQGRLFLMILTDGIILVDTTENKTTASKILEEFCKITDKPIKGIVLTHLL